MTEKVTSVPEIEMEDHWQEVAKLDGVNPHYRFFKDYGVFGPKHLETPYGFDIDGQLDTNLKDRIKTKAYPLKVTNNPNAIQAKLSAQETLHKYRMKLNSSRVLPLIVPDAEKGNWSVGIIAVEDLFVENPAKLLSEALTAAVNEDYDLMDSKRIAFMAVTGRTNTEYENRP